MGISVHCPSTRLARILLALRSVLAIRMSSCAPPPVSRSVSTATGASAGSIPITLPAPLPLRLTLCVAAGIQLTATQAARALQRIAAEHRARPPCSHECARRKHVAHRKHVAQTQVLDITAGHLDKVHGIRVLRAPGSGARRRVGEGGTWAILWTWCTGKLAGPCSSQSVSAFTNICRLDTLSSKAVAGTRAAVPVGLPGPVLPAALLLEAPLPGCRLGGTMKPSRVAADPQGTARGLGDGGDVGAGAIAAALHVTSAVGGTPA